MVTDMFDLTGQVALVTGGSRGLGLEMAKGLGQAGAQVVITGRRQQWLDEATRALEEMEIPVLAKASDISDAAQVHELIEDVRASMGPVDVLINNAGVGWAAPAVDMPLDRWEGVLATNVTGTFLMTQEVGRSMLDRGRGSVINISSIAGLVGVDPRVMDAVGYATSKGAIIAFTRDLAVKWAGRGVRVNAIAPGFFPTRMSSAVIDEAEELIRANTPLGRVGRLPEIVGPALFLASEASSYVTGHVLTVDGGASAW